MVYIYSSTLAVYVFDDNFSIIKEKKIQDPSKLDLGIWVDEEKHMIDAYLSKKEKVIFVGNKEKSYHDVEISKDVNVVNRVVKAAKQKFKDHFDINMALTKKKISNSLDKDFLVIQTSNAIQELDKIINQLSKRVREMYAAYSPEVEKALSDNYSFIRMIVSTPRDDILKQIGSEGLMSAQLSTEDYDSMISLAKAVEVLIKEKEEKDVYLEGLVHQICPNVVALAGEKIAAKLLAIAGSLRKLAFFPSSTVQTLGAEKALFAHLKSKAKPPKYGVIMGHPFVNKAKQSDKGKVSRDVANKISLMAKVDYFGTENSLVGYEIREQLEERYL